MFFFDPLYFIMLAPAFGLSLWATFKVKRTFARYNRVPVSSGRSGRETAE
ncbi:MAG: peptidase, partial [Acidobacteria bacterium]|nr:peptidase [Acidobacteriota bacterium]